MLQINFLRLRVSLNREYRSIESNANVFMRIIKIFGKYNEFDIQDKIKTAQKFTKHVRNALQGPGLWLFSEHLSHKRLSYSADAAVLINTNIHKNQRLRGCAAGSADSVPG